MLISASSTCSLPAASPDASVNVAKPSSLPFWGRSKEAAQVLNAEKGVHSVKKEVDLLSKCWKASEAAERSWMSSSPRDEAEDAYRLVAALKACADRGDLSEGSRLHDDICRKALLQKNLMVANAVVNMYAKCGALEKAQEVFDALPIRDVISWNVLISGYSQHGHGSEAICCFEEMQTRGFAPTAVTIVCILKACGSIRDPEFGKQVHARIIQEGLLEVNLLVANALVDMYAKCGCLLEAERIFNQLHTVSVISWNTLITGYIQHEHAQEALSCLDQMRREGFIPTRVTFVGALKGCGIQKAISRGLELHAEIVREGSFEANLIVGTALVDMYANCGMLLEAQDVFDGLEDLDVVSWTALITGYAQYDYGHQALASFQQMQVKGLPPNAVTYAGALKACGCIKDSARGQDLHAQVLKVGSLERDIVAASALIDMYAKLGMLERAEMVFDEVPVRDVLSWNSIIGGYSQHDHPEKALDSFVSMLSAGFHPNAVSYACVLKACGSLGTACKGQELHDEISRDGLFSKDIVVGTALLDMYANCGMLLEAQEVFKKLPTQDKVAWNTLLGGFAELGEVYIVVDLFKTMINKGVKPSHVTFNVILNACSHKGHLDMGQKYFEVLAENYNITPMIEHFCCIIDLFGRAGHLLTAAKIMECLPLPVNPTIWHTFLNSCMMWGHLELADWAFPEALRLDAKDSAAYICMNNIFVAAELEDASL